MSSALSRIIFNKYLWLIVFPLFIGWFLLAERLEIRTYKAVGQQLESVKQIWGDNLAQPMPSIRYKRFGSDVSTLSQGDIQASDIAITLEMDYRKKGLVYYTGYNAKFTGKYTLQNPESEKIYLSFIFPYPTQNGVLQDIKLLINGEEDPEDTEYQPELALWTGTLNPTETLEVTVRYHGRGLNQFEYGFEPGKQINHFLMKVAVQGADALDYAESTMPPTQPPKETPTGKLLTWQLDSTLSQFDIGIILPDKLNVEKQLFVMTYRAPVFFLLFLFSLLAIFFLSKKTADFTQVAAISIVYFLFYPLFAYLAAYMDVILSFAIAFAGIGLLIFNYVRTLHGFKLGIAVFTIYLFYLGVTSVAALLPTYTGLILTIEGVVLMGVIMQILSRYQDFKVDDVWQSLTAKKPLVPTQTPGETP